MSLRFLPSYLRDWIDAEYNSTEKDVPFDFQEITDEKEDWVVINHRKTTNEEDKNELDDLLSQYVFIKTHTPQNETDDSSEKSTEYSNDVASVARDTRKKAKRRIYGPNKLRCTVVSLKARRYSPYVGMPHHFPRIAVERIELPTAERMISSSQLSFQSPIKAEERVMENCIVPYQGNKPGQTISSSEILQVFDQLAKTTCTAIVQYDHSQSNQLLVIPDFSVKYTSPYQVANACYLDDIFTTTKSTKQLQLMSPIKDSCDYNSFLKNSCDDVILQLDYREPPSKLFSINPCAESLYARLCSTKTKFEDLLRSIMFLHFILNKQLESWKSISNNMLRNFPQFTNLSSIMTRASPVSTMIVPQCDTIPSFATTPDKSHWPPNTMNLHATKQLRRQNRCALLRYNATTCSNRQRGMKRGRFQNNVGHRESWR